MDEKDNKQLRGKQRRTLLWEGKTVLFVMEGASMEDAESRDSGQDVMGIKGVGDVVLILSSLS